MPSRGKRRGRAPEPAKVEERPWQSDWSVGVRVWLERARRAVLGEGRLALLEGIDRTRSISAAARQMGMSYRRAWLLVQEINEAAGHPLVAATTGGLHGGGARLTPSGRQAIALFRQLRDQVHQTAASLLPRLVQRPGAPGVHVVAAASLEEVISQLVAAFALKRPDVRVRAVFGASDELADHLLAGGLGDVFLSADLRPLRRLAEVALAPAGSPTILASNTLAAIAPADTSPAVRRLADLARSTAGRVAMADLSSPLGRYTRACLEQASLVDAIRPRAVAVDNARAVIAAVRGGLAEVGLAYSSDAFGAEGCRVLFQVRRPRPAIRYVGAVLRNARHPQEARAFLDYLTSPPAAARFRACGFLSARCR